MKTCSYHIVQGTDCRPQKHGRREWNYEVYFMAKNANRCATCNTSFTESTEKYGKCTCRYYTLVLKPSTVGWVFQRPSCRVTFARTKCIWRKTFATRWSHLLSLFKLPLSLSEAVCAWCMCWICFSFLSGSSLIDSNLHHTEATAKRPQSSRPARTAGELLHLGYRCEKW